jgi:DnaK suppressor protein
MDQAALKRYRQKLHDLKAEILAEGDIEIEPGRKDPAAVGSDEDEQPLAEMSQAIASSRNRSRADVLARVGVALSRIEEDPESFGLCTECDEPISEKRLQLMPYVELCVECQQAQDGPRNSGSRRHLRDFR